MNDDEFQIKNGHIRRGSSTSRNRFVNDYSLLPKYLALYGSYRRRPNICNEFKFKGGYDQGRWLLIWMKLGTQLINV